MNNINPQLEGAKVLSLTDSNGQTHEFISETEQEKEGFKLKYYMWLSRLFIFFAILSLLVFMSFSLALFKLAPQVSVEPFLIINQDTSEGIVRAEAITNRMASKNKLMEIFVAQFVILRNTIIDDEREQLTSVIETLFETKRHNSPEQDEKIEFDIIKAPLQTTIKPSSSALMHK